MCSAHICFSWPNTQAALNSHFYMPKMCFALEHPFFFSSSPSSDVNSITKTMKIEYLTQHFVQWTFCFYSSCDYIFQLKYSARLSCSAMLYSILPWAAWFNSTKFVENVCLSLNNRRWGGKASEGSKRTKRTDYIKTISDTHCWPKKISTISRKSGLQTRNS